MVINYTQRNREMKKEHRVWEYNEKFTKTMNLLAAIKLIANYVHGGTLNINYNVSFSNLTRIKYGKLFKQIICKVCYAACVATGCSEKLTINNLLEKKTGLVCRNSEL